ncbi:MAG: phosphate ABC transporter, permease protein PstA, partial [Pseudomonadota bacterium]
DSFRRTVEDAGIDVEATVAEAWTSQAVDRLDAVGLTGAAEIIAAAGAPADAAGLLGQTGNALRAAATALGGDDADAAAEALAAAQTALSDAGFADAAAEIADVDAAGLAATGYQQALFDAAGNLRQPAGFDDAALASLIFASNRRDVRDRIVNDLDLVGQTQSKGVPIS